jgi:hypothetical protein
MRYLRRVLSPLVVLASLGVLGGCAADSSVAPEDTVFDRLAGSWRGTEFVVSSLADPSISMNLVEMGGGLDLDFTPAGAFSGSAVLPGAVAGLPGLITIPLSGVVKLVDEETLRIDFVPEVPPVFSTFTTTFTLDEHRFEIVDPGSSFDFDKDGVNEPARIFGVFLRN